MDWCNHGAVMVHELMSYPRRVLLYSLDKLSASSFYKDLGSSKRGDISLQCKVNTKSVFISRSDRKLKY